MPSGIKAEADKTKLIEVVNLGLMPLANDFTADDEEKAGFAPLKVTFCPRCTLAQLSVVVRPEILYEKYVYTTSKSQTMRDHFKALCQHIADEIRVDNVLEIGSNTGEFLKYCQDERFGCNVEGIDPAQNLAKIANANGIRTTVGFLDSGTAKAFAQDLKPVDVIFLRHVWAHLPDWHDAIKALEILSNKDALICIEVPWVMDQLAAVSFDQIYFEHLSYVSVRSIFALLKDSPFFLYKVLHYPIHGGCVALLLKRKDSGGVPSESCYEFEKSEEKLNVEAWQTFADEAELRIMMLKSKVHRLREQGKRVAGYGASAKATTWLNAMKLTRKDIEAVYDDTLQKLYKTIPGTEIPVVHEGAFYVDKPDYAINFAWSYRKEIEDKQAKWHQEGGKWIYPVPRIEIV